MRIELTLCEPDGRRREVALLARSGSPAAALAAALSVDTDPARQSGDASASDPERAGAALAAAALTDADVRPGAVIGGPEPAHTPRGRRLVVVGGPDTGAAVPLARTPVVVGRSPGCDLVLSDPAVSRRHLQLVPHARGVLLSDLASARGTSIEDDAVSGAGCPLPDGALIRAGDSYLRVIGADDPPASVRPGPDGTTLVNRAPYTGSPAAPDPVALPERPDPGHRRPMYLLATLVPALAGVAFAMMLHSPQFLLFALLSPLAMLASTVSDRIGSGRERRRGARSYRRGLASAQARIHAGLAAEAAARRAADPDPGQVLRIAELPAARLWERRRGPGLLAVRIGVGARPSHLEVSRSGRCEPAGTVLAVPLAVDLAAGGLGIAGPPQLARGTARWVIGQLAALSSPADVEIRALCDTESGPTWSWLHRLPQFRGRVGDCAESAAVVLAELSDVLARRAAAISRAESWTGPWVVLLVDPHTAVAQLPGLAEVLTAGAAAGVTAIVVDVHQARLPAGCASVALVDGDTGSTLRVSRPGQHGAAPQGRAGISAGHCLADRVTADWAEQLSRALAPLRDPASAGQSGLPSECELLPLLGLTGAENADRTDIAPAWGADDDGLRAPLGVGVDGPVVVDLVRDGPHALVAGTTGSGKSELLRTWVCGLAARYRPDEVSFLLIDYKGGAAFAECAALPHTCGVVTDLDKQLAARALRSLDCELRSRETLFATVGASDISAYRCASDTPLPRLVIVVDEFAELAGELGEFVTGLVGISRRGRSLGVHLVLATQRPAGVVSAEIRANAALRIALRVTDAADSQDVLDAPDAVELDRRTPGRGYLRRTGAPLEAFQTALVSRCGPMTSQPRLVALDDWGRATGSETDDRAPRSSDLARLATALDGAAARSGVARAGAPWLPPLPESVPVGLLSTDDDPLSGPGPPSTLIPIGLVDLPDSQRQEPLFVDVGTGSGVLLAGGPGSGRTSALITLAVTAAARLGPQTLHVHLLDFAGGGLARLALPHCGSVLGDDATLATRLVAQLNALIGRRRRVAAAPDPPVAILLLVDGWEQLGTAAEEQDCPALPDQLLALMRSGTGAGLTTVVTGDRGALSGRLTSAASTRLTLRLSDHADYALAGLPERSVPASLPPGRALRCPDGAEVQLAHLGRRPDAAERDRRIAAVARRWPSDELPASLRPLRMRPLPELVRLSELPSAGGIVTLGVGGDDATPIGWRSAEANRLLVAGPPRSGRSTALLGMFHQLAQRAGRQLVVAAPVRSPLTAAARLHRVRLLGPDSRRDQLTAPADGATVLVDDAEAFLDTDTGAALDAWATDRPRVTVVVTAGSDELAVTFRGVAATMRRSRCAVLLNPGAGDGELVGVRLPRRRGAEPPGRGVLVGPFRCLTASVAEAGRAEERAGPEPVPVQLALPPDAEGLPDRKPPRRSKLP